MTTPTHTGETRLAGVTGWPVSHSLSPVLHGFWLKAYGIDGAYVPLPIAPGDLGKAFEGLRCAGFRGWNVTVPHKEAICDLVDEMSPVAARIGAVNTVICRDDGTLYGDNTDAFGFRENILAGAVDGSLPDGPAVIFGAGGAARAIIYALHEMGFKTLRLCNRTQSRAQALADHFATDTVVVPWENRQAAMADAALVINTTTLGMAGHAPLDLQFTDLHRDAVVTDIVYTPLVTPFLAAAQDAGYRTVDGLGMLLHQARPGFEAWFGVMPSVTDELRQAVLQALPSTS